MDKTTGTFTLEALGFPQRPAIADRQDVRFHELPHEQFVRPALRSISKRASKCRAVRLGVPPRPTTTAPLCCLLLVSITSPFRFSNSPWRRNEMPKARGELHETPAGYSCVFFFFSFLFSTSDKQCPVQEGQQTWYYYSRLRPCVVYPSRPGQGQNGYDIRRTFSSTDTRPSTNRRASPNLQA